MSISQWFSDAKQSLAVAGPICTEGNSLVQSSRKEIEQATTLWAQIVFMHEAITEQINMLHNVHKSVLEIESKLTKELDENVVKVEKLHSKLNSNLEELDGTTLDPAFGSANNNNDDGKKTLRSFVFENGLKQLEVDLKSRIDDSNKCKNELKRNISKLAGEIQSVVQQLVMKKTDNLSLEKAHEGTDTVAEHAHAMAILLESLTRHYDQCLKAAELEEEDKELLQVLEKDSHEVSGVVSELFERRKSMKSSAQSVSQFKNQMKQLHQNIVDYFELLDNFCSNELSKYLDTFNSYLAKQRDILNNLAKLQDEINSLVDYYERFYQSYQAMVLEVIRRNNAETNIQSMVQEMNNKLQKEYQDEIEQRNKFIKERGDYLPSDLWTGLTQPLEQPYVHFEKSAIPKLEEETLKNAVKFSH